MSKNLKPGSDQKGVRESRFGGATVPGVLYDRHGPIPVPDVHESDTESAWAMFEESVMLQDHPITKRDELRHDVHEETQEQARERLREERHQLARADFASTDIAPPDFLKTGTAGVEPDLPDDDIPGFERTRESPLR